MQFHKAQSCDHEVVQKVVELANEVRLQRDLAGLECSDELSKVAYDHAWDMCDRGFFGHGTPEGSSPALRAREAGLDLVAIGENIAMGNRDPESVHEGWMNSSGHRENILRPRYEKVGIGAHHCDGRPFWVQMFGRRPWNSRD